MSSFHSKQSSSKTSPSMCFNIQQSIISRVNSVSGNPSGATLCVQKAVPWSREGKCTVIKFTHFSPRHVQLVPQPQLRWPGGGGGVPGEHALQHSNSHRKEPHTLWTVDVTGRSEKSRPARVLPLRPKPPGDTPKAEGTEPQTAELRFDRACSFTSGQGRQSSPLQDCGDFWHMDWVLVTGHGPWQARRGSKTTSQLQQHTVSQPGKASVPQAPATTYGLAPSIKTKRVLLAIIRRSQGHTVHTVHLGKQTRRQPTVITWTLVRACWPARCYKPAASVTLSLTLLDTRRLSLCLQSYWLIVLISCFLI